MMGLIRRIAMLGVAALVLPACGKDFKSGTTLFAERFNGSFPGADWTTPALTGSATATIDGTTGAPAPSLKMTAANTVSTASTQTTTAFSNPNLSISVQMAAQSSAVTEIGTGTVAILDSTPAVIATATWDNTTNEITFHINGGSPDQTVGVIANSTFHRLLFTVSSTGSASWSFDNGTALVTRPALPAGLLKVQLSSTFGVGTASPSFFFDFVNVTSP